MERASNAEEKRSQSQPWGDPLRALHLGVDWRAWNARSVLAQKASDEIKFGSESRLQEVPVIPSESGTPNADFKTRSERGRIRDLTFPGEDQKILRADMNAQERAWTADFQGVLFGGLDEDVRPQRQLVLLDVAQIADLADGRVKTIRVGDPHLYRLGAEAEQDFLASVKAGVCGRLKRRERRPHDQGRRVLVEDLGGQPI